MKAKKPKKRKINTGRIKEISISWFWNITVVAVVLAIVQQLTMFRHLFTFIESKIKDALYRDRSIFSAKL